MRAGGSQSLRAVRRLYLNLGWTFPTMRVQRPSPEKCPGRRTCARWGPARYWADHRGPRAPQASTVPVEASRPLMRHCACQLEELKPQTSTGLLEYKKVKCCRNIRRKSVPTSHLHPDRHLWFNVQRSARVCASCKEIYYVS